MTKNLMQLKTFIKKKATEDNTCMNLAIKNYMLEQLLEYISLSKSHFNFILNGRFKRRNYYEY